MADPVATSLPLPPRDPSADYRRAELEFHGVDHSGPSFEVRVFFNKPDADASTPLDDPAYAGRFHIFGHGGCFGEVGHCDVPSGLPDPYDLRLPHPLTPVLKRIVVTDALRALQASGAHEVAVTAVPLVHDYGLPRGRDADRPLKFESVALATYE